MALILRVLQNACPLMLEVDTKDGNIYILQVRTASVHYKRMKLEKAMHVLDTI